MGKFVDLTGQIFERLTVIKRVENYIRSNGGIKVQYLCKCNCKEGNEIIVKAEDLKSGNTQSCGCINKEKISKFNKETKKKYNTYDLTGEYGIGYTFNNEVFYFDLEDYDKIKDYCWYFNKDNYVVTNISGGKSIFMHRLVTNCPDNMEVDHIYHDEWDNRKEFLRIVTISQNEMNKDLKSNNTSGVTGVCWHKKFEKWVSRISINKKRIDLGYFDNFEEAVKLRKQAEEIYYGEFAFKNKLTI